MSRLGFGMAWGPTGGVGRILDLHIRGPLTRLIWGWRCANEKSRRTAEHYSPLTLIPWFRRRAWSYADDADDALAEAIADIAHALALASASEDPEIRKYARQAVARIEQHADHLYPHPDAQRTTDT